jgi:hypothetical protein
MIQGGGCLAYYIMCFRQATNDTLCFILYPFRPWQHPPFVYELGIITGSENGINLLRGKDGNWREHIFVILSHPNRLTSHWLRLYRVTSKIYLLHRIIRHKIVHRACSGVSASSSRWINSMGSVIIINNQDDLQKAYANDHQKLVPFFSHQLYLQWNKFEFLLEVSYGLSRCNPPVSGSVGIHGALVWAL